MKAVSSPPLQQSHRDSLPSLGLGAGGGPGSAPQGRRKARGSCPPDQKAPLECLHQPPGAPLPVRRGPCGCPGSGEQGGGSSSRAPRPARRESCSETCPDRLSREGKPRSKRRGCERVSKPGAGSASCLTACGAVNSFSACRKAPGPQQASSRPRALRPQAGGLQGVCARGRPRSAPSARPLPRAPTAPSALGSRVFPHPRALRPPLLVLSLALPSARPLGSTLGAWRARVRRPCGNSPLGASPAQALSPPSGRREGQKAPAGGPQ